MSGFSEPELWYGYQVAEEKDAEFVRRRYGGGTPCELVPVVVEG